MRYTGSKKRFSKYILPIVLKGRLKGQYYVEPFVGGANMISSVRGKRIGADINKYVIGALKLIRDNPCSIPDIVTEEMYKNMKDCGDDGLKGYIGYSFSFGSQFFAVYRRDVKRKSKSIGNMIKQSRSAKKGALLQSPLLKGIRFVCSSYLDLDSPPESIVYCDPPYDGTTGYNVDFDHCLFWDWCRRKSKEGYSVFVSEYSAPSDFDCLWSKEVNININASNNNNKKNSEKLFIYRG